MGAKIITEAAFSARARKSPMAAVIGQEVRWLGVDSDSVIGAVIFDKIDKDYAWVVLGPDPVGNWRAIDMNASLDSEDDAEDALRTKLEEYEQSGQRVWKQD